MDDRHDPWGDLIRGKQHKTLPRVGLDPGTFRITAVTRGPESWASAPKYGISLETLQADTQEGMEWAYERLEDIQATHYNGLEQLERLGNGTQQLFTVKEAESLSRLRAAGKMHADMGEPQAAAAYFKVARAVEDGNADLARRRAAAAYWIVQFHSALGSGELEFANSASMLLDYVSRTNEKSVTTERDVIQETVRRSLRPGLYTDKNYVTVGLLQPGAIEQLIQSLPPDHPMLEQIAGIRRAVVDAYDGKLPAKYRDLERWQADLQNLLEEAVNTSITKADPIPGGAYLVWKGQGSLGGRLMAPTRHIPFGPLRHTVQAVRSFNAPLEATGAAPLSWIGGMSKLMAAAAAPDIDIDGRIRLVKEAGEHFMDPANTILSGNRPKQTWGEHFGKKGESIVELGKAFETAGKTIQKGTGSTTGYGKATEMYGIWLQRNAQTIGPWLETGVFVAATLPFGAPGAGAGTSIGGAITGSKAARTASNISALYPLAVSTPESAYPLLGVMAAHGGLRRAQIPKGVPGVGGLGLPHLDPHTGAIVVPRAVLNIPGVSAISRGLESAHPVPRTLADFFAMHKMGQAQHTQPEIQEEGTLDQFPRLSPEEWDRLYADWEAEQAHERPPADLTGTGR